MKGLVKVITASKRAARWRRMAEQMCESLLRLPGNTGRDAKVVDGYIITATRVGKLATGRVTPLRLMMLTPGTYMGIQFEGVPVETRGVIPYDLVYSWSDRDTFETWADDWEDWFDPTSNRDRGPSPLPISLIGRFYADVLFGPDVGPIRSWTVSNLSSRGGVSSVAALISWPDYPGLDFFADVAVNPMANLGMDIKVYRPGGVTKFAIEEGPEGEEVVELPPSGPEPYTLRYDRDLILDITGGYRLTAWNRYDNLGGSFSWPVSNMPTDSTPDRTKVVSFIPVYKERWPDNTWPGTSASSPFEYYGVHGLLVLQSVIIRAEEEDSVPVVSEEDEGPFYEWTYDFIDPYDLPHPDLQRRPAEEVQRDPDWFGETFPNGEVIADSVKRGSFCRMHSRKEAVFDGGVALLMDVRHFTQSLLTIGLEPPGPPTPSWVPEEIHPEERATYTTGLVLVRVFDDGEVHTEALDTYTNDPSAGKTYSVAASHTSDGKAIFHVLRAVCTDQELIDEYIAKQWYGAGSTGVPPRVPFGRYEMVTYHVSAESVEKYVVVPDVRVPDFVHLDYRYWDHLQYYNVTWDQGFGQGVAPSYWRYSSAFNPAAAIDQFRSIVLVRSYHDVEQAQNIRAGWVLAYMYDSRDQTYSFLSVLAESTVVGHVKSVAVLQYAELDPETGEEVNPAVLVLSSWGEDDLLSGAGYLITSRTSGRSWSFFAALPGWYGFLGNAATHIKPGELFN